MISRKHRLSKDKDINAVHGGEKFFTNHFVIKYIPNNLNYSRFTILVSNKVSKSAVIRNRVKRFVRGLFVSSFKDIKPGYDILLSVSASVISDKKQFDKDKIKGSVAYALNKTNLLND